MSDMAITAIASWYGSNRLCAKHVGRLLRGCEWVGVPFMGGGAELRHIKARTVLANDLHAHVINMARVMADPVLGPKMYRQLRRMVFHPETLADAQHICLQHEQSGDDLLFQERARRADVGDELDWAVAYFIVSWMGRSALAGTDAEFTGGLATRFTASGGDSATRFRNATSGIAAWRHVLRNTTFECMDGFDFIARCKDQAGHGLYCDPPFPGPGSKYTFNCGKAEAEHRRWHERLAKSLRFKKARVVCRFYEHPMVRELYPEPRWVYHAVEGGKKQSNDAAPELLITNTPTAAAAAGDSQ